MSDLIWPVNLMKAFAEIRLFHKAKQCHTEPEIVSIHISGNHTAAPDRLNASKTDKDSVTIT